MGAKRKLSAAEQFEKIDKRLKGIESRIDSLNTFDQLKKIEKRLQNIDSCIYSLSRHINRPATTIKVKERTGHWDDYTGIFKITEKEEKRFVLEKAIKHFKKYFKNVPFYAGREFAIMRKTNNETEIVKILQTKRIK